MSKIAFYNMDGVLKRTIELNSANKAVIKDMNGAEVALGHASRHSSGGADPIPAAGLRLAQFKFAKGSIAAGGTSYNYTIPHGLGVVPTLVEIVPTTFNCDFMPELDPAPDATNIYVTEDPLIGFNWLAIV